MTNWRELTKDEQVAALQNVAGRKMIPLSFDELINRLHQLEERFHQQEV